MITKEDWETINLALMVLAGLAPKPPLTKGQVRTLLDLSDKVDLNIYLIDNPPNGEEKPVEET